MVKARDLDWLVFNKKLFIGGYCIQFKCESNFERLYDVGIVTGIKMNDFGCFIDVNNKNWFLYSHDIILPELQEDEDNLIMDDKMLGIRCIFLKKDRIK